MELEQIWSSFLEEVQKNDMVTNCCRKNVAGIPFLYIVVEEEHISAWENRGSAFIHICAKNAMFRKKVTSDTHYVRQEDNLFVYRHRFYVPQEKMFCCGNLCSDCIRLR